MELLKNISYIKFQSEKYFCFKIVREIEWLSVMSPSQWNSAEKIRKYFLERSLMLQIIFETGVYLSSVFYNGPGGLDLKWSIFFII